MTTERPISFNAEMVRAILGGRKTQTRRIIKPQPLEGYTDIDKAELEESLAMAWEDGFIDVECPYGKIGNRLLVDGFGAYGVRLEITDVHIERLNDISGKDALAEGLEVTMPYDAKHKFYNGIGGDPIGGFKSLWEKINGKDSWTLNPWVWVIEFKRVEQ